MGQEDLDKILNEAEDFTSGSLGYVTTLRFVVTSNEVFVDLYILEPSPTGNLSAQAKRTHRIAMPIAIAKDFAQKLLQGEPFVVETSIEDIFHATVTGTQPDDLWKQIDALYGAWSHLDDDTADSWIDNLRDRDNSRLKALYGEDWE
jgi:hypothetical protein